jgi:hypothetical protein
MLKKSAETVWLLVGLLMAASVAFAGGVDPKEMAEQQPVVREKVTATPAQTSAAVSKARRAVVPKVEEVRISKPQPKAVKKVSRDSWQLASREGECAPLSAVSRKVKNIGTFTTPQGFARQMQQRGYQAFALDIGDAREQVVRVKVPDLKLDLTFMKAGLCR